MTTHTDAVVDATVLVADDDEGVRTLVTILLRRAGYQVVQAANGREALDTVRDRGNEIDTVLLDVLMPEMDGHDTLPAVRGVEPKMPVIFISGFDQNEVADHLTGAEAHTSFLPKPFENAELLAEVRRAVHSRR